MSYSIEKQGLRCPFCGSTELEKGKDHKVILPQRVIRFRIDRTQAESSMLTELGKGFWRPPDLSDKAVIENMVAIYVPYWVFSADVFTNWTADTSQTPVGADGDWYPLSGTHQAKYSGILVGASGALTPNETSQLCPFNLEDGVPPEVADLETYTVEEFNVARKYARPLARSGLESLERRAIDVQYVPGSSRNVKVNLRIENMASEPICLPVWIMAYSYKDQVFRFLVNGQTGNCTGQTPVSYHRLWQIILTVLAVVLAAGIIAIACGGIGAAMQ